MTTPQPTLDLDLIESVYELSTLAADVLLTFITTRVAERGIVTGDDMRRLIAEAKAVTS